MPPVRSIPRRQFIASLAALAGSAAVPAWAEQLQAIGAPQRFDYAALKGQAGTRRSFEGVRGTAADNATHDVLVVSP